MIGKKIGFLGGGNMAGALIKGLLASGAVAPGAIWVSDVKRERLDQLEQLHGVRTTLDNHALVREVDVLVVSVKPQVVVKVLGAISGDIRGDQVIVSVAAGVPLSILEAVLPEGAHVVRTMPNTPAIVQAGATAIAP